MNSNHDNRQTATAILQRTLDGLEAVEADHIALDDYLDHTFKTDSDLRAPVTNLLFTYYRHKAAVDHLIDALAVNIRPRYRRLLAAAVTQMHFNRGISPESAANVAVDLTHELFGKTTAGFVNAVLRRAGRADLEMMVRAMTPEERANVCPELYRQWKKQYDDATIGALSAAAAEPPPSTFRLRREELPASELAAMGAEPLALEDWAGKQRFYRLPSLRPLLERDWLEQGWVYVQDPATALAPELAELTPDSMVLDLCAAPGGKSLMLAEKLPDYHLVAGDRSPRRQELTQENFRHGNLRQWVVTADALQPPFCPASFDLVLADVPCSNTGVGRQRPDAWWNFSAAKLRELVELQQKIMLQAAALVKKGGQLIYSTCSIENDEDRQQVERFLAFSPEFQMETDRMLLPGSDHDGAYAARLRRRQ